MIETPSWLFPPPALALSRGEVHLWRAWLDRPAVAVAELALTLSDEERERAGRFHFERDRRRFVVSHGLLRSIISRYTGLAPERVQFRFGPGRKPSLAAAQPAGGVLYFNLSHAHEVALYAFTGEGEVGVDLEFVRSIPEMDNIASRYFSAQEYAVWRGLPAGQQQTAFFNCWTRKEAYIKALGTGLAQPLDRFVVSLAPGEPARLLQVAGDPQAPGRWTLLALTPAPGYVAALALESAGVQLAYWRQP